MTTRGGRVIFVVFLVAYTVALTWPGLTLANRVRPFVLGLPFIFFWIALWVALGLLVFWAIDRLEARGRRGD
ncbi:MAG: DUF3311 domain-containing protein [Longimicrobiales bacterium]